ncbi:MAG: hypothetical protein IT328_00605 [Caldilineaceae bacterium]|nr:hypothetical protein [Caldilineaceae bacterium]
MANARRRTQRASRTGTRSTTTRSAGSGASAATMEAEEVRAGRRVDWANEFVYINKDLRQLFIVTIILFVLLFVVGFFL